MGLLTTLAASVAQRLRLSASVMQDFDLPFMESAGPISGPVLTTAPKPQPDGLQQLKARRAALLAEASRHKNLRRSRAASTCEAELRRVTHEILRSRPHA